VEHFCIITNKEKDKNLTITKRIEAYLIQNKKTCFLAGQILCDGDFCYTDSSTIPLNTECIIVLGGDGTILHAAHDLLERNIPMLGINLGTLGFLAEIELQNCERALDRLIQNDYTLEERMIIKTSYQQKTFYALNDFVIARSGYSRLIKLHVYVNSIPINEYTGDGIIISTPTGSTAYNLSAGGPVVTPGSELMLITPICPHSLGTRSIVISANDEIRVEVKQNRRIGLEEEAIATIDGQDMIRLNVGDSIVISRSKKTVRLIKLGEKEFFQVLQTKLGWGTNDD